jgi:prepilin-type N-terminal cleavage/methylation domain-containing protein
LPETIGAATIFEMGWNNVDKKRRARGFTIIELMIVVALASVLATIAIPYYQKLTARAQRAELFGVISKLRIQLINTYQNTGTFPAPAAGTDSTWNPADPVSGTPPPGSKAEWRASDPDWINLPSMEGSVRMRYQYSVTNSGRTLTLTAVGIFPGIPGMYTYAETWNGSDPAGPPVEFPAF